MRLQDKLNSIPTDLTVNALHQMLDPAKVKFQITWFGQRLVSIEGYEGTITINRLAEKYLKSSAFTQKSPGLQERLDCDSLWDKVSNLYEQSDEALKKMCIIFRALVFFREFIPSICGGDPKTIIEIGYLNGRRTPLFAFEFEEYQRLWPNKVKEDGNITKIANFKYNASEEIVKEALKRQNEQVQEA